MKKLISDYQLAGLDQPSIQLVHHTYQADDRWVATLRRAPANARHVAVHFSRPVEFTPQIQCLVKANGEPLLCQTKPDNASRQFPTKISDGHGYRTLRGIGMISVKYEFDYGQQDERSGGRPDV